MKKPPHIGETIRDKPPVAGVKVPFYGGKHSEKPTCHLQRREFEQVANLIHRRTHAGGQVDLTASLAANATAIRFLLSISHSLRPLCAKFRLQLRSRRRAVQLCPSSALLLVSLQPLFGGHFGRQAQFPALRDDRPHHSGT